LQVIKSELHESVVKSELQDINLLLWEKKGQNCKFISHNSEKKVRIARCKLAIMCYKVRIKNSHLPSFFIPWQKQFSINTAVEKQNGI